MMSTQDGRQQEESTHGRQPVLIIGGVILLIVATILLLFGNRLWGAGETQNGEPLVLEQVPEFNEAESVMPQLPTGSGPLMVGDVAYDFALQDLAGNEVRLAAFHGRPVIVNFWASWCAPCRIEMPELQAAYIEYQDDGLVILALDQQEPASLVSEFFYDEMGLTFTPLLDSEGSISEQYGVNRIFPSTFFINPDGKITAIHRGPMAKSQIDGYLAETIPPG